MLQSKSSQFTLSPNGEILWQEKLNNPLPGVAVARLEKGDSALRPNLVISINDQTSSIDQTQLLNQLKLWLKMHIAEILEPLILLETPQGVEIKSDAVSVIVQRVYEGLGIVPRETLEDVIAGLTPETRADLRAKKIRLGPVLAFIPALNKPAAVKLRALLWSLYNNQALPAKTPSDGIVSVRIEEEAPNEAYYRAIGYPLYGTRAVRIDMLDRVISCIYDHADKGKFQARHEMAEWLGCSIEDLYKVLEAMGHVKIYDLLDELKPEVVVDHVKPEETETPAPQVEELVPVTDESSKDATEKPKDVKPELAIFRLKKGKAFEKAGKGEFKGHKKSHENASSAPSKGKKDFKKGDKKFDKKKKDNGPRVMSFEAKKKQEDSPFAILQQLKK